MKKKGIILPIVVITFVLLSIMIPLIIKLVVQDSKSTVSDRKKSIAFSLAEGAVDRGFWKVKSSTGNFNSIMSGGVLTGYNFDKIYEDLSGGVYRIKISSGPDLNQITIIGEGKDFSDKEKRAIKVVFENKSIYSPLITNGNFTSSQGLAAFWGPIMAQGNFDMTDAEAAKRYFPRKYAKGIVTGQGSYTRDTNGLNPPNTDNIEWWSVYDYVPELPILDFEALRSSAVATGTLNRYDKKSTYGTAPCKTTTGPLGGVWSICKKLPNQPSDDSGAEYVWYWDGDLVLEGHDTGSNYGFKGSLIVRGNLTIRDTGAYKFTGPVPRYAYKDHYKLLKTSYDTASSNEYPADIGYQANKMTFNFGTEIFRPYPSESLSWKNTVGARGFTYVGGNLNIKAPQGYMDFIGAVWVVGNVTVSGGGPDQFCGVFFDENLSVPTLNVILLRKSWEEIKPEI